AEWPSRGFETLHLPDTLRASLANLATAFGGPQGAHRALGVILLAGARGAGRHAIAEAVSAPQKRPLVTAGLQRPGGDSVAPAQALQLLQREALLRGANLYLGSFDSLFSGDPSGSEKRGAVLEQLSPNGMLIFASASAPLSVAGIPPAIPALSFQIPA